MSNAEPRIDAREKVTGKAKYIEDLPDLPGMTYGAALLSPYAHARIRSIDSSKAKRLPGVLAVLDREHLDGLHPMLPAPTHALWKLTADQPVVAIDKVRFDGDLVAMVAAEDLRTAKRAVELIDVEYEPLLPVFDATEALASAAPILHESKGTNLLLEDAMDWGDVAQGFKEADRIFEQTYTSPSMFHHPMESIGGCIAHFVNDTIMLWEPTSSPFREAKQLGGFFGLDADRVRIQVPFVGGGFGSKLLTNSIVAAIFLSRKTGRPIRLVPSLEESFRQNARHAMVYKAKIGVKTNGTLTALDVDLVVDTGAYTTSAGVATHNAVISAWGCYRIPHLRVRARCAYTNKVPAGHARATGKIQTTWGIESAIDSVAREMGIEPLEFRRKNVLLRGEFVAKGTPLMDTDYLELMRQTISATGWNGSSSMKNPNAAVKGRRVRGWGIALGLRHGSQDGARAYAMATINAKGVVKIQHNAPEIGQGTFNLISVIASKTLGVPQSQIQVGQPDTAVDLPFVGVNAQRTTMQMGNAVQNACQNLKRDLIALVVKIKGGGPEEWQVVNGYLCRAENGFSFSEIVGALGADAIVNSIGFHEVPPTQKESAFHGIDHWAPSAGAVEVEVDRETGELRVLQYSVTVDAGKALHYPSAKAQVEGGGVMGFGHALFEEVVYQDGQILNADPFQYRLPIMEDIPEFFHSLMLENSDGPGPFGSKGMSQTSIVTVAPAIGNAIYDALGIRLTSLPITPEKILKALGKI
jgi:CO/xanthine dehydrogenase Mo-binding subunit